MADNTLIISDTSMITTPTDLTNLLVEQSGNLFRYNINNLQMEIPADLNAATLGGQPASAYAKESDLTSINSTLMEKIDNNLASINNINSNLSTMNTKVNTNTNDITTLKNRATGLTMTKVWSNSNTTSMGATRTNVSWNAYPAYLIVFRVSSHEDSTYYKTQIVMFDNTSQIHQLSDIYLPDGIGLYRDVEVSNNKIYFDNGWYCVWDESWEYDSTVCVPVAMYGISGFTK